MIYLDNAAATKIDPEILEAMTAFLEDNFGNPSSLHSAGKKAKAAIEEAGKTCAQILNCNPEEIIFTSGGTESCNLAIQGVAKAGPKKHIITSNIEHSSVLQVCEKFPHTQIPSDKEGVIDPDLIEQAITKDTALVTIGYANSEIGTIQNIKKIAEICQGQNIPFHTDASQAAGYLPLNTQELGVTTLSLTASKIYGPTGIGLLYIKNSTPIEPITFGGDQQNRLRPGTENTTGIIALAKALQLIEPHPETKKLRDHLLKRLTKEIDGITLNGHPEKRLPNNLNISIEGLEGESILLRLDQKGIAVATGSACSESSPDPSHILRAIAPDRAHSSIRITLSKYTTREEIDQTADTMKTVVKDLRGIMADE